MAEKKKTISINLVDAEVLDSLINNSPDASNYAIEVNKLLAGIDKESSLVVLKQPVSTEKIKEALGIFREYFKTEFDTDDEFLQALCGFFIDNYKDYDNVEQEEKAGE